MPFKGSCKGDVRPFMGNIYSAILGGHGGSDGT